MALIAPLILTLACLGAGAMALSITRLLPDRPIIENLALSFAIGFGLVGWLFFWLGTLGLYSPIVAWIVCGVLAGGVILLWRQPVPAASPAPFSQWQWLLLGLIALALGADFLEALAPPVEADSLAYHFQLPKQFIAQGRLMFEPRALDGAIPLLVQMTYVAALLLGGGEEMALTLWTFISGWGAGLLLYAFARRWLDRSWSLALLALFQTLPAMLYGAGSGQVEPRLAMFVLIAAFGLVEFRHSRHWGPVMLIGLGAGFFAAGKYTGLLFVAAAGLALLLYSGRGWLKNGLVCGGVALLAGFQWYGWNAYHTGDPVFPLLFTALGLQDSALWDADYAATMADYLGFRQAQIDWWQRWLAYPVLATLLPTYAMEAGRVGLGPYMLMIAPMAGAGVWRFRHRLKSSTLAPAALMAVLFYGLWLAFGGIPKVRHLLPILPVFLVCLALAAHKAVDAWPRLRHATTLAMVLSLAVNIAVVGFFARPYIAFALGGFDRNGFLENNVNGYPAVAWLNEQPDIGKVLLTYRAFRFHLRPDNFYAFPGVQKQIEARPGRVEPALLWRQMKELSISHILTDRPVSMSLGPKSMDTAIRELAGNDCLVRLKEIQTPWRTSRTLATLGGGQLWFDVWRLNLENCSFNED